MAWDLRTPSGAVGPLDRAAHLRTQEDLLPRLLAEPGTRLLFLDDGRVAVRDDEGGLVLALRERHVAPAEPLAFLGRDDSGRAHLLMLGPGTIGRRERLATLREVGAVLDAFGAELLTTALALANWHGAHPRCSRCGEATRIASAGWARRCPGCGTEHHPRTDPAVIMAIVDDDDRILLGHQRSWPAGRFSTLAGFVEPGESLEDAVRREVVEEAGVRVGRVDYHASQAWPFPSSLMLGFTGHAVTTAITVDGDELAEARWWSREELALDVATDEITLPPPVSISRHLIESWYGGPIRDAGGTWR